jgi:HK97 family phage prohead protease
MREREFASFPLELAQVNTKGRVMEGYASVFNYPIESGRDQKTFVKPGAFTKTLKENRSSIQVLFNHGMDPRYGLLPIGKAEVMQEDKTGLWTEVELHDGPDNENIKAALASGSLRAQSIQFESMQESFNDERTERYIEQVRLYEFGPVTFPANEAATATLHSMTAIATLIGQEHWDGGAAMKTCSNAAEFRKIAFERANDSDPDTAAHWALPHHPRPGAGPDSAGVAAALAALHGGRGGAPDLKQSVTSVENHLQGHQAESSSAGDRAEGTSPTDDRLTRWLYDTGQLSERALQELAKQEAWLKRTGRRDVSP